MNQQKPRPQQKQTNTTIANLNAIDLALESQKLQLETFEFLRELLPVFDGVLNMCRGLERLTPSEIVGKVEGLSILADVTDQALVGIGLARLGKVGEATDPSRHEVIDTRPSDDIPHGTVIEVLEHGWDYQGKVLRTARVVASAMTAKDTHK